MPSVVARRFTRGERVLVSVEADTPQRSGKVARAQGEKYVIDLDGGGRHYAHVTELLPAPTACMQGIT